MNVLKNETRWRPRALLTMALLGGGLVASPALAQPQAPAATAPGGGGTTPAARHVQTIRRMRINHGGPGDHVFAFSSLHGEMPGAKPMKGAPFKATAVTEMEQVLGDGNRIRQKSSAVTARDSAGRTRREIVPGGIGPLAAPGEPRTLVHLHDPNAGTTTMLDLTARKAFRHRPPTLPPPPGASGSGRGPGVERFELALPPPAHAAAPPTAGASGKVVEEDVLVMAHGPGPGHGPAGPLPFIEALPLELGKPTREELGTQVIEGVRAEGSRTTLTIPAGKLGNERPLVVVSERWFSPELGVVVMSRHSDPRLGTTTYRLTGIERREPPANEFEVPPGFDVQDGPAMIRRRIERPAP